MLVNVKVFPIQTVVSLAVNDAVGVPGTIVEVFAYCLKKAHIVWQ